MRSPTLLALTAAVPAASETGIIRAATESSLTDLDKFIMALKKQVGACSLSPPPHAGFRPPGASAAPPAGLAGSPLMGREALKVQPALTTCL